MKQNFTVRQGALDGVEAFLSVARHRSFRRAAAELGVTPSAISQAIRALEARIGAALFIRTTRSVGLTEAGERFLSRARPAFEELVAASEAARDLAHLYHPPEKPSFFQYITSSACSEWHYIRVMGCFRRCIFGPLPARD
jgi:hypothetical protein